MDQALSQQIDAYARELGWNLHGGAVRRSSSRFCLSVEHGDYNGTELFGVGTDRFIWLAFKPNGQRCLRLFSGNYPEDGVVEVPFGALPAAADLADSWARFPAGALVVWQQAGLPLREGFDAILMGNIPGGGMSRSASLSLNLLLTLAEVNGVTFAREMDVPELAQRIENDYIGSPCGLLDQVMIYFARAGMGTRYSPAEQTVEHVPLGSGAEAFCFVSLDTGTQRHGLEKSTYAIRRAECEELVALAQPQFGIRQLAEVREETLYRALCEQFGASHPSLIARLKYIYEAQHRFGEMLLAWQGGDIARLGAIFRQDGNSLRDDYVISGPELQTMCDIARTVPGVYGERMLGGGDKGASGAIVRADAVQNLRAAVEVAYPRAYPHLAEHYALHSLQLVDGITREELA